jgi:hypothetical protein
MIVVAGGVASDVMVARERERKRERDNEWEGVKKNSSFPGEFFDEEEEEEEIMTLFNNAMTILLLLATQTSEFVET